MNPDTGPASGDANLREYLDKLLRRKWIILNVFLLVLGVNLYNAVKARPRYLSTARILVQGPNYVMAQYEMANPLANILMPDVGYDVATQMEVIQSDRLLSLAYKDAEIPPGSASLRVQQVGNTLVLDLMCESFQPRYARALAETLPDTYRRYITDSRKQAVVEALEFAQGRLRAERASLRAAEEALARFKKRAGFANLDAAIERRGRSAGELESRIRAVEVEITNLEAQAAELRRTNADNPALMAAPVRPKTETGETALKDRLATLQGEREALLLKYKPDHLEVRKKDIEIEAVQKQIANLPKPEPSGTEYDRKMSEIQIALSGKRAELDRLLKSQPAVAETKYVALEREYGRLQREVQHRSTSTALLQKQVDDLSIRQRAGGRIPVRVLTPATAAFRVGPPLTRTLALPAILGLFFGIMFALLLEYLDDRVRTGDDARSVLAAPVLGYIPLISAEDDRLLTQSRGGGSLLEAYRVMRSNVQFAAVDSPIRSLVVTSTSPGEGKSVTATNLAVAMALDGRRVILVDADLRRPSIHHKLDLDSRPGLTNVLLGHIDLAAALQPTSVPGLQVLTAGMLPPNPAELLNSQAMRNLHAELKRCADIVIFDSSPFLATADAQVLAAEADGVIYVVQHGGARKSAIRHSADLLNQARANLLGIVLNKINLSEGRDSYYYYYYYRGNYYSNNGAYTQNLEDGAGGLITPTSLPKHESGDRPRAQAVVWLPEMSNWSSSTPSVRRLPAPPAVRGSSNGHASEDPAEG